MACKLIKSLSQLSLQAKKSPETERIAKTTEKNEEKNC